MKSDKSIVLSAQKNSEIDEPEAKDIYGYGCISKVLQLLKLPDGTVKVLVEGVKRVKLLDFKDNEKFITCDFTPYNDVVNKDEDLYPLAATALRRLEKLTSINKKISNETINTIKQLKDPSQIADNIASHITATISEKQQIFETADVKKRLNSIVKIMENETSIIGVEKRIRGRVKTQMEKTQREYYLNEQLKAIQKELRTKNVAVVTDQAWTEMYVLPGGVKLDTSTEDLSDVQVGAKKGELKRAFGKMTSGRKNQRPLLNKFIGMIA